MKFTPQTLLLGTALATGLLTTTSTALAAENKWDISKLDATKLPPASTQANLSFTNDIVPIFQASCFRCHNEVRARGGLRLDNLDAVLKGGKAGAVVVPGSSDKSLLILAVSQQDPATAMPPKFRGPPGGTPPQPNEGPGGGPPMAGGPGGPNVPPSAGLGGPAPGGIGPRPKALTPDQVALVRAWIDQGAK